MLNWSSPGAGANAPLSYDLEVGSASGLADLLIRDVGDTTTLTATDVPNGTYYISIRGWNLCGFGEASPETVAVVGNGGPGGGGGDGGGGACTAAPGPATNLTQLVIGSTVFLDWDPPAGTASLSSLGRNHDAMTYVLQVGSAPGLSDLFNKELQSGNPWLTADGVARGTYYVRVLSRNDCGTAAQASNEVVLRVN